MHKKKTAGKGRGFLSMSREQHRKIASMGGKAAHAQGRAHKFTSSEAAEAGHKGGTEAAARRRAKANE